MPTWAVEQVVVTCLRWQIESVTGHSGLTTVIITSGNAGEQGIQSWAPWRQMCLESFPWQACCFTIKHSFTVGLLIFSRILKAFSPIIIFVLDFRPGWWCCSFPVRISPFRWDYRWLLLTLGNGACSELCYKHALDQEVWQWRSCYIFSLPFTINSLPSIQNCFVSPESYDWNWMNKWTFFFFFKEGERERKRERELSSYHACMKDAELDWNCIWSVSLLIL